MINKKYLKFFIMFALLLVCGCAPSFHYPPLVFVIGSSDYLVDVNDEFVSEYVSFANKRDFVAKDLYGTYYIPKGISDNMVAIESQKKSTSTMRFENCINSYYWNYGVYLNNGEEIRDIPKELNTKNTIGNTSNDYYYSFLQLNSSYSYKVSKRDITVVFDFYNCFDVLEVDSITPIKERDYIVNFYNIDEKELTPFYSIKDEKNRIIDRLSNSGYNLANFGYIDSYYVLLEGNRINICDVRVELFPVSGVIADKEVNISSEDIKAIIDDGYISDKFNVIDEVITDEYFGLSGGVFDKYYIESIITKENLDNEESN